MPSPNQQAARSKVVIIGGGASGYFAAINCAQQVKNTDVILLEGTRRPLQKVKISGGGRCNVTHNCLDPKKLVTYYPRGHKELRGPFSKFSVKETIDWFAKRGVTLRAEDDGRMFSTTNTSETIIHCLKSHLEATDAKVMLGAKVSKVLQTDKGFNVLGPNQLNITCDKLLIATGSAPIGHSIAAQLGHTIIKPVPSLFTFKVSDPRIENLPGLAVEHAHLTLKIGQHKPFKQEGPLLITHWGLSGPAVLKLSAWAARELYENNYSAKLQIDWLAKVPKEELNDKILAMKQTHPQKNVQSLAIAQMPKRLWSTLTTTLNHNIAQKKWIDLSHKDISYLISELKGSEFTVNGKGVFKEEFVTCGGISLKEVNFKTMESKLCPKLYFSGEVLDIDGVTGGFNFQNAWTTAWLASHAMAETPV